MSIVRDILHKSNLSELPPPRIKDYFEEIPDFYYAAIAFSLFATLVVIGLTVVHLFFVLRYVSHPSMQTDLYWIVFLCPIVSICNSVGICAPRTAAFLYSVGIVYFLLCIFVLVTLMTTLYGSRTAMCTKLDEKGVELNPRVFPLGCCLVCLPNIKPTVKNVRMLEWAVFQSPIIRVIIEIVSIAVYFEFETKQNWFFTPANLISFISMIIASYSSYILMPAGCKQLRQYRFLAMFRMVDWAQFIYNVQKQVLEGIVLTRLFGNIDDTFGPTTTIQIWTSFLATQEMLILSCMATYFFRPSKAAFFDKYSSRTSVRGGVAAPSPSPNPFACYPALEAPVTEEAAEQFSPKIVSKEKQSKIADEKEAASVAKESNQKLNGNGTTTGTLKSGEKLKSKSKEQLELPQQQQKDQQQQQNDQQQQQQQQQISPNDGNTKTPATATATVTTITPLQTHTSIADPNSTTNVEILQVEPTQEMTDNKI